MTDEQVSIRSVPLGETGWRLWCDAVLRSAGFAAEEVAAIRDLDLAAAADSDSDSNSHSGSDSSPDSDPDPGSGYRAAYAAASARLAAATTRIAADPRFREAVAWQNPDLVGHCLDKVAAGVARNSRGRQLEAGVISYLQRYALKNDTIGFYGPVGWARLDPDAPGFQSRPGPELLAGRTTHFEMWAVDEVARAFAARPDVEQWLTPTRSPAVTVLSRTLYRPRGRPVPLTGDELAVFEFCDGDRTVADVLRTAAEHGVAAPETALKRLVALAALRIGLEGPVDAWPERGLRHRIARIGDARLRDDLLAALDSLIAARDAAAEAADAESVVAATRTLGARFREITGGDDTRRAGQAYAGRTLLYQDSRRDVEVVAGTPVLDALAAPLGLVLDSVRWLVAECGRAFRTLLTGAFRAECVRSGHDELPLPLLLARCGPDLTADDGPPCAARAVMAEFQQRWQRILGFGDDDRRITAASADLAAGVAREFGGATVPWCGAGRHSPDLMIAAASAQHVASGDFLLVLGELHVAVTSVEGRGFVEQSPDPGSLLAAVEQDYATGRIVAVHPKDSPFVTSRAAPPTALPSDRFTYWTWSETPPALDPPGPWIPGADLVVRERDGAVLVATRSTGAEYDLLEVLGEILSAAVANTFRPIAAGPHSPRVTVDRLVMARETWRFPAEELAWAFVSDDADRYRQARRWRAGHGLPERVFARTGSGTKPTAVDFTSPALVGMLARTARRAAGTGQAMVTLSEMLPDVSGLWLSDAAGKRYTSELRVVAVDGDGDGDGDGQR
ncbi:hypothetical protein ABH926_007775 [Catenulispora sp. GP43]|uniref:lantibiotic dehydratase n=1 Tax=Catenulispora sp. GP43 TaxID=3156263 RepID=UPI003517C2D1